MGKPQRLHLWIELVQLSTHVNTLAKAALESAGEVCSPIPLIASWAERGLELKTQRKLSANIFGQFQAATSDASEKQVLRQKFNGIFRLLFADLWHARKITKHQHFRSQRCFERFRKSSHTKWGTRYTRHYTQIHPNPLMNHHMSYHITHHSYSNKQCP